MNTNFSKPAGFKKLGIHKITLAPGECSSLPHAESLEEEFAFVISGNPHVWIDGFVYELNPHSAVGFPSGTGIAHNIINNTNAEVELLVVGERTKKENLCSFPVNPEQKEKSEIWWADAPVRKLGPHNGQPGPVKPEELNPESHPGILDCTQLKKSSGWHYPGDNETFVDYVRLTNILGLKELGIGYETLQPGRRSAFPHCHSAEEEFAFILSGHATIWINGFISEAKAGEGIAFSPGTNTSHTIINNSEEPLTYIAVGEDHDDEKNPDKIFYPMHEFRNAQCCRNKDLWLDRPLVRMGPHNGRALTGIPEHLCFRHATPADESLILEIFKKSPNYFIRVDGIEPSQKSVKHAMQDGPEKRSETYLKEFLILEYKDAPIGVLDVHINHPESGIAYIGLLLLQENMFGKKLGRRFYELTEHYLKTVFKIKLIRLGISDDNDVSNFWKKMDFFSNGKTYTWQGENKSTNVTEYDKTIANP